MAGCEARFGGSLRFQEGSPTRGLADLAAPVAKEGCELASAERCRSQLLEERGPERAASPRSRMQVDDADTDPDLGLRDLDRQLEVGVVVITTAVVQSRLNASSSKNVARLTSEPFSSVLTTSAVRTPLPGFASGIRTRWLR